MNTKQVQGAILFILPASLLLGGLLALASPGGTWWIGWLAFTLVIFLGLAALAALWRWTGSSRTLAWILAIALLLRLGLGVAFSLLLPAAGTDSQPWNAGYFFLDPFRRDVQAWDLAVSDEPLWHALDKSYATDQYGGLLALSALAYRALSPDVHRPLLVVAIAALAAVIGLLPAWKAAVPSS